MKAISSKGDNLWAEVEKALDEHTTSGYKMACIEAQKVFLYRLRSKGYSTKNLDQTLALFGWRLSDKAGLKNAIDKTEQIKNSFDYTLSSFETEDIVAAYAKAISDFSKAKTLSLQRRLGIIWDNYISFKSSFTKKVLVGIILFFVLVKLLSGTAFGRGVVDFVINISNFFFSWFLVVVVGAGILVFVVFGLMTLFEKNKSKIKIK